MNAPLPLFTSSTSAPIPSAIFLLMIDAEMSGTLSIVPVTSRSAYSFLSAGAICAVWPISAQPIAASDARISDSDRLVRKPGIDSSLSRVPPVCPSPRPDIIGTTPPHAATMRRDHDRRLVADPAGAVLVDFDAGNVRQIDPDA